MDEKEAKIYEETAKRVEKVKAAAVKLKESSVEMGKKVVEIGKESLEHAKNMDVAMNDFLVSTGKSKGELEQYKKVMTDIYANNFGESFDEIGESMAIVAENMNDLKGEALQKATEGAYTLKEAFGVGLADSTRLAGMLMDEFGMKSGEAMDFLAANADKLGDSWGEVGEEALTQLVNMEDGVGSVNGAMEELQDMEYGDLNNMMETLNRNIDAMLIPLGDALIPILENLITTILPVVQEYLPQIMEPIAELISGLLPPLLELFEAICPILVALLDILMPIMQVFIGLLEPIISLISGGLTPLMDAIMRLINGAMGPLQVVMTLLAGVFREVLGGIFEDATSTINSIKDIFNNVTDFFKNIFTLNIEGALGNLGGIFYHFLEGLYHVVKMPVNWIVDGLNALIKGANNIKFPDWVPGLGGKGLNIPLIPRFKSGLDYVPSDFFPAFLDEGEMVLTRSEANWVRAMGGLEGLEYRLSGGQFNQDQKVVLGKGCIVVQTMLDGRTLAQTSAPYMNEELGNIAELRNRGV